MVKVVHLLIESWVASREDHGNRIVEVFESALDALSAKEAVEQTTTEFNYSIEEHAITLDSFWAAQRSLPNADW